MSAPSGRVPPFVAALLRVPLYYKILIANAALVVVGAVAGATAMTLYVRGHPERSPFDLVGVLIAIGIVSTAAVNALILRIALKPLESLERTAERVQRGDVDCRAPLSPVADREMERLTETFNGMLDAADATRERLREVASRALAAAEEERKRIARELHDETAQMLAALLIRIRLVRRAGDPAALDALLDDMRGEIGEALEGVRRFARGLRPPALDELGLVPAMESHLRSVGEIAEVALRLDAEPGAGEGLPPEAELAVYRIVQEALSNVVRHSGARAAAVRLRRDDDALCITVADDGRGFSVEAVMAEGRGLGLFGMRERAGYLGGRVEVESRPGAGTTVRAEIPLPRPGAAARREAGGV